NLPVNLKRSMTFFTSLGYIFVMLLTRAKFKSFTPKEICDATKSTEVLVCLSSESRQKVDELVRKAVAAGGKTHQEPQDHVFMYGHGFQDLDGHILELVYMEPNAIKQPEAHLASTGRSS